MERSFCEKCGERQPVEWKAGDLCTSCGAAVRRDVRCAWCAQWVPAGRFCRRCGCEVVEPSFYGAARMLKNAGVDRFSLTSRLQTLDPEQVQNLGRIFETQLAVVARRVEEVRLCETSLLQKFHSKQLEEALLPLLPLDEDHLAPLAAGPAGPFQKRPDLLFQIAECSPIQTTRQLAALALLRAGRFERRIIDLTRAAVAGENSAIALEAVLALAHWRTRAHPYAILGPPQRGGMGVDCRRMVEIAAAPAPESPLRPWAAAAFTMARFGEFAALPPPEAGQSAEETDILLSLRSALRDGLTTGDPDLRFTCALALGDEGIVSRALPDPDEQKRTVARRYLAKRNSPGVGSLLSEGGDEMRMEILGCLSSPLPATLIHPVLAAIEHGDESIRYSGSRLLLENLTPEIVERLIIVARRHGDAEVFRMLLDVKNLPASEKLVPAIIASGLFLSLCSSVWNSPEHVDFSHPSVVQMAARGDEDLLRTLAGIAASQLDWMPAREEMTDAGEANRPSMWPKCLETGQFLARLAFGSYAAAVRMKAFDALRHHDPRLWKLMSLEGAQLFLGSVGALLRAISQTCRDAELHEMCRGLLGLLSENMDVLAPHMDDDRAAVVELAHALLDMVCEDRLDYWDLETYAVAPTVRMAAFYPEEVLPPLVALFPDRDPLRRCDNILLKLRDGYRGFGPSFAGNPRGLDAFIRALLEFLKADVWMESPHESALALLELLAQDYPECRDSILGSVVDLWKAPTMRSERRQECLLQLAEKLGYRPDADPPLNLPAPPDDGASHSDGNGDWAVDSLEELDDMPLLPDEPVATLAAYVRLLKEMNVSGNLMEVAANQALTLDQCLQCVAAWSHLVCTRNDVGIRYAQLLQTKSEST